MTKRSYQPINTKKQPVSTAPAQGMFQSRSLKGRPSLTVESQQKPDLKASLTQAERYGHHLNQTQLVGVSTPESVQPKMAKSPVIQCVRRRRSHSSTHTATEERNVRPRHNDFVANRNAIEAQAPNLLAGQQRRQQRANFEANRNQVAPGIDRAYRTGNRENTLNRVLNTFPGHGHVMHGAGTTPAEQRERVRTGQNPAIARPTRGGYGNQAWTAGRFNQHAGEYQAVMDAYRTNPIRRPDGRNSEIPVHGPQGGGQGFRYNQANNTINPINQPNAQVVLRWNNQTSSLEPLTQYPTR